MLGVESSIASQTSLYREAITAFQNAVKLNRMLSGVWFKLGCAALRVEDWETGAWCKSVCELACDLETGVWCGVL